MSYLENEFYLSTLLKNKLDIKDLNNLSPLMFELNKHICMDYSSISQICYKNPDILKFDPYLIINNLKKISGTIDIRCKEFHYLIVRHPYFLSIDVETFLYKINLIKTVFGCSVIDVLKMLYSRPYLMFLSKQKIINQIEFLSQMFDDYGMALRRHLRACPELLFADKEQVEDIKKCLMRNFTFSQAEVSKIFRSCPELAVIKVDKLSGLYNFYYPKYFIKRDFKEMMTACPEIFKISQKEFVYKISEIKKLFNITDKEACQLIRINPNIMFYPSFENKLNGLNRLFISKEYIKRNLSLLNVPEISIPLKFVISRILGLDSDFNEICNMDSNLFISRFLFMQNFGVFNHKDLLLKENEFEGKYHISTRVLLLNYKLDYSVLENITSYYVSLSDKLPNWRDILFPSYEQIWKYINSVFYQTESVEIDYLHARELYSISKDKYDLIVSLKTIHLDINECLFLINKNCNLINSEKNNILKIVVLLKKYGFNFEQIIKLMFDAPSIFTNSIKEFDMIVNQIIENEKCSVKDAVYRMI